MADEQIQCACGIAAAEQYASFIDDVYRDLVAVFGVDLENPISLHLFPTEQSYYAVNPLAERLTGVIAHALNDRQEIAVAVPRTDDLSAEEVVNNIRHELTHLFVSFLSEGKLTTGFQEGIAQYLERPTARANYDPALLRVAFDAGRLFPWADLDQAQQVYSDPQVAYPQTLAIVSFLVDRYGFPTFLQFVETVATEPGYRSAMQVTYGKSADLLEAEWLAYLPDYFAGRWQVNAIYAFDLGRVSRLVEQGAYSSAEQELDEILALLETTDQEETLAQAASLMAHVHQAQAAGRLADAAREALMGNDYALAIEMGRAAIAAYEQVGYRERTSELELYIERAHSGQVALSQLVQGERLLDRLRFAQAEERIYRAAATLQSLGNQSAATHGIELLHQSALRQRGLAFGLLAAGMAALFFNGLRRALNRLQPNPFEMNL